MTQFSDDQQESPSRGHAFDYDEEDDEMDDDEDMDEGSQDQQQVAPLQVSAASRKQNGNKVGGGVGRKVTVQRFTAARGGAGKGLRTGKNVDYNEEKNESLVG